MAYTINGKVIITKSFTLIETPACPLTLKSLSLSSPSNDSLGFKILNNPAPANALMFLEKLEFQKIPAFRLGYRIELF